MNIFARRLTEDTPLMTAERLAFILGNRVSRDDVQAAEHPYFKQLRASVEPKVEKFGDVAVVPVQGALAYNPDPWEMLYAGVEDSRNICKMLEGCKADPEIKGVLLRMDTPGGMMLGGVEIADAVDALVKSGKPVVTHIGGMGCSLGYLIAAPSTEIIASRSSIVGSIGVISSVVDYTEMLRQMGIKFEYFTNKEATFKAAGATGTKLSDEQRGYLQERVDSAFTLFKDTVNSHRPQVKAETMRGQVMRGEEARSAGLVDAIGTESVAMTMLRRRIKH